MSIAEISGLLTGIKAASDILLFVRNADFSLEKAELKFKLSELMSALADVKIQAAQVQDVLLQKDEQIKELTKALELKAKVKREGNAYYEVDTNENAVGDPYCSNCWETSFRLVHLNYIEHWNRCPFCKTTYEAHLTRTK